MDAVLAVPALLAVIVRACLLDPQNPFHHGLNPGQFPPRLSQPESQPHHLIRIQSSLPSTAMASEKRRLDPPCADREARMGRQRQAGIGAGDLSTELRPLACHPWLTRSA
ncbi:uncharacterized protein TrAFT101_007233 [Trichoderma asperellum]|uniref:uncharacterized protein n=1 Tax=Trichoderma asperellum TaxID=101201 RepID=UPI00332180F5|nr:hypothetical protein TrAFT101_007233 [Trichoderma asperellum]